MVILGGTGPLFSSGHDMGSKVAMEEYQSHPTSKINGATRKGAESRMLHCQRRQKLANFGNPCRLGIAAGQQVSRQWLDMGFDFDLWSEFVPNRFFEPARDVMRGGKRQRAVDFQIERHR